MSGAEWVWPVLASLAVILVFGALELLSTVVTLTGDSGESVDPLVDRKRAA
jgi:hypothetical protein